MTPTITLEDLNAFQLDVLKEVGNIGAGNATTALATMVDRTVEMTVPKVGIVPLSAFAQMAGGPETISAGVYMPVVGDAPGHVAFLWSERSALRLVDRLLGLPCGTTGDFDAMAASALVEIGNIMASSYLNAIAEMTGLTLCATPPALAVDMTAAILSTIAVTLAYSQDQALTIVTQIGEDAGLIEGYFIYIPEPDSLAVTLRALHMEG